MIVVVLCTPTDHEKAEWKRLAADAYRLGLDATGRRFAFAAAQPAAVSFDPATFDALQAEYREWLIAGFPAFPHETLHARGL